MKMKKQIKKLHKEIEDRHAQAEIYLQWSIVHQKTKGSLKVEENKILELQQKIMEKNKHSKEMQKVVKDTKELVEAKKQRTKEV